MKLALTLKDLVLVNVYGIEYRLRSELRQLGLEGYKEMILPIGFKDWGEVEYNGERYYMSTYSPPIVKDDFNEDH